MVTMDGLVFSRSIGNRSISASAAERTLLLGALATHMGVLDTRENDSQTVTRKAELWDEITRHFNSNATTPRSRQQIQTLYKNMKAKARRYEARLAEMANGIPPPDPDPISEMLLGLLQQQLRHQRRHLRNLMARDTSGFPSSASQSSTVRQTSSAFINPEQMMQVFLSEGTTEDADIKSENGEGDLERTPDPNKISPTSQTLPETLESIAKPPLPMNLLESTDDSKLSSSPLSSFTDVGPPSPVTDNCPEDLSPNLSHSNEIYCQNLQSVPNSTLKSSATKDIQCRKLERYPQNSLKIHDFETLTNSLDAAAALKNIHSSEEVQNKRSFSDTRSETASPTPKRPYLESFPRNHTPSFSKPLCCHWPEFNAKMACCSPETHTKILAMAQEEHQMKITFLKREMEQRDREHETKMKSLMLELEEAKLRIEQMRMIFPGITENNKAELKNRDHFAATQQKDKE
ncbi:uncharacterized protein LOC135226557 [Macrobrachium nipponense]|uniref:uncharacterized protein LOC135226557 n=1 Tax=Macrobrachium nipponense TaxID=159736 RepID=UPI0030C7ACCB